MKKIETTSKKHPYTPPKVEVTRVVTEGFIALSAVIQAKEEDWDEGGEVSDIEGDIWF